MSFTTLQNTPIEIDLVEQGKSTGWTVNGTNAIHEQCNAGSMYLLNYPLTVARTYTFTYRVNSISGGSLRVYAGDTAGALVTTTGDKEETLTASGTDLRLRFYSTADLNIDIFNIREVSSDTSLKKTNVIAWNETNNKWSDFRTSNPDCAFSLFTKLFSSKQGVQYVHDPQSGNRNEFYGTQYKSIIKVPFNGQPTQTKTFQSVALQNNQLMITTTDGIVTSLGQVSELYEWNFEKARLIEGATEVVIYENEGVYSASFLRNKTEDIHNGSVLKGNYLTVELETVNTGVLELFTVAVHSEPSRIGVR